MQEKGGLRVNLVPDFLRSDKVGRTDKGKNDKVRPSAPLACRGETSKDKEGE